MLRGRQKHRHAGKQTIRLKRQAFRSGCQAKRQSCIEADMQKRQADIEEGMERGGNVQRQAGRQRIKLRGRH
jgi:hypothetical protein